jgi:hypothetical protein
MDEFDGIGGSYIVDPETGSRTLIERTQEPQRVTEQPVQAADQPAAHEGE